MRGSSAARTQVYGTRSRFPPRRRYLGNAPERDPVATFKILFGTDGDETGCFEQCAHRRALAPAMLEQQPATLAQMRWRADDDPPDRVEAVGTGCQRGGRLMAQVVEVRVTGFDVRRVAGDQVEAFVPQASEPVALAEFDVRQCQR